MAQPQQNPTGNRRARPGKSRPDRKALKQADRKRLPVGDLVDGLHGRPLRSEAVRRDHQQRSDNQTDQYRGGGEQVLIDIVLQQNAENSRRDQADQYLGQLQPRFPAMTGSRSSAPLLPAPLHSGDAQQIHKPLPENDEHRQNGA
ncbi:hypothetical protein D1872_256880 [compost metagenome]